MATTQERYILPRVNVLEDEESVVIEAEVPGVSKDEAQVEVRDGKLIVKANRHANGVNGKYRLQERPSAGYYRTFALTDAIDQTKVEARLNDGILTITLAKSDHLKPRTISVN